MQNDKMNRSMAIVGKVYQRLYESGLSKQILSIESIKITETDLLPENREAWSKDNRLLTDIVEWLHQEGAISH